MNDYETGRAIIGRDRELDTFPKHWGMPPFSEEERRTWIVRNIREGEERLDRGERVEGQLPRTYRQLMAALALKRGSPAEANAARLRFLELLARGPV